jgi:hypothetical protein
MYITMGQDQRMGKYSKLFRVAAIASLASAMTTAILIYGSNVEAATDFITRTQLHDNPLHLYKRWVLFFHPQFAFIASIGIAFALFRKSPALIAFGLFYLATWAITEMTQQAVNIVALNEYWRPAYLTAGNQTDTAAYYALLKGFEGYSESLYFVLLFGFGMGTLLFGLAFTSAGTFGVRNPETVLGIVLILIGVLSLTAFLGYYSGLSSIVRVTDWIYAHFYGVVQIGVRIALGVWLWYVAANPYKLD